MSVLTRIKNNQITDSTIWANAKIIPGSIVGSLFNSNITVTSDFTITGNLTVQGAATYLTVASTNTYVNDPLVVLNNAFSGANQYDLGFIFNRGSSTNQAFYWDESTDEFKLIATSETGTTYGNIAAETSYSNFRLGNLYLNNYVAGRALYIGSSGLIDTEADYTYDATNNTLAVGDMIFRGNSATISSTGTDENIVLAPNGAGTVDFNGANATNLADPLSAQDAVTLAYIQSTSSSAITNIGADDSQIIIVDDGTDAGQINVNVDATSSLVIKSNSLSVFGTGYTGSSPKVYIDAANSNVGIISTLFVSDDLTTGAGSLVKVNDVTNAVDVTDGGALTVKGGASIAKDLWVGGNLYVANIYGISVQQISVSDPLLYLTASNLYPATYDIGFFSQFIGGAGNIYQHTGVVRDASDGVWKFFSNSVSEPTSTITFDGTELYDGLKAGNLVLTETGTAISAVGFINTSGNVSAATVIAGQFNTTGNLVASQVSTGTLNATGLINTLGNISASRINADTLAATGTIWANAATDTSSLTTGALIVAGGAAVGKTMWVGEGMRINSTQAAETFHVLGQGTDNSLIYADLAKNAIVFGGANAAVQDGAVVKFNSDGAIVVPVGSSAQRPGAAGNVDVAGMLRFSTTSNNLEFYDGSAWTAAGSQFTVIATNSFNGDGSTVAFTLSSSSTTAGTLVMVNGVVQIPVTAYSVSGTTLTFTEAPASGDVVDARTITTTATVSSLSSGNGYNTFDVATIPYANITAGTSSATVRVSVDGATGKVTFTNDVLINGSLTVLGDSNGNINIGNETGDRLQLRGKTVYDQTAINVPDANLKELDSFSVSAFTTARYTVQVKNGSSVSAAELIVSHDTATSNIATYAVLSTLPGTFQSNISSGTVKLFYTPSGAQNANIKVLTTYIV